MTVDVLESFSVADHDRVRAVARPRELQPGDCLYDQGAVATAAFLVTGGVGAVVQRGRVVNEITAGDILGDADVLGRRTYRTRIEAVTQLTVWQIDAHDLDLPHPRAGAEPPGSSRSAGRTGRAK